MPQFLRHAAAHTCLMNADPSTVAPGCAGILSEITATLAAGSDLPALLQRFLEPIVRLAGAQAGAVRVLDGSGSRLDLVSQIGLPEQVAGAERSMDRHCGVCGQAAGGQALVWADDLRACSQHAADDFFGASCRRVLAVPLQYRGQVLGIYNLFMAHDEPLRPEIASLLKSIGELLGLALHNARLEAEHLRTTVMRERAHMAAEVHDSVAQTLTYAKMRLPLLRDAILQHDDEQALKYFADLRTAVSDAHTGLRHIITQFRSRMDPQGLAHALDVLAKDFPERSGIDLQFVNELPDLSLPAAQEAEVFHVVREALANVARHSGARHAWLRMAPLRSDGSNVEVCIEDDGRGLPAASAAVQALDDGSHYGLKIMGERARRLHGEIDFGARPGGGTSVRLVFPPSTRIAETQ
jgi:two-component system, NarL family, nitrate/nitrite sensor histidine kinase NarX